MSLSVRYEFKAQSPDLHKRLDLFLVEKEVPYSRSQIKKWIDDGRISVNGKPEKSSYRIKTGDFLQLSPEDPVPLSLTPENIPLSILYEDQDLLVLDKPAGLVVHPAPGNYSGTLVHCPAFSLPRSFRNWRGSRGPGSSTAWIKTPQD